MSDGFMPGIVLGTIIGVFVASIFWSIENNHLKARAIQYNAAEWLVEPRTGETTFTWKEPK